MVEDDTALLADFFDRASDLLAVGDSSGRLLRVNAAWRRALGWDASVSPRDVAGLTHPDDREALRDIPRRFARGEVVTPFSARYRHVDGSYRTIEWREITPSAFGVFYCVASDVTDNRRVASLAAEVERLSGVGGWEVDLETGAVHWTPMVYAIHGLDPASFKPTLEAALAFYPSEAALAVSRAVAKTVETGQPFELEAPLIRADGRQIWVRSSGVAERLGGATTRLYGALSEITEARARRLELERLSEVARRTINPVMVLDAERRILWVNAAFERRSGYPLSEALGRRPQELLAHPNNPADVMRWYEDRLNAGEASRLELLRRAKDGTEYWADLDIHPTRDAAGVLTGWFAVETDVTSRREHEDALASAIRRATEAQARLVSAVESLPDAFAYYDRDDRLVICNERYREFYPLSADAFAVGARFEDLLRLGVARGEYRDAIGCEEAWIAKRLEAHRNPIAPHEQRLSNGRWLRVFEKNTPDGGVVGMRVDVTELKQAEERLAEIIRGAGVGTWEWNVQTGEVRLNERWAAIIGRTLEELEPISIQTWIDHAHPEDAASAAAAMEPHFRGEAESYACEARMRHKDGHWVWILDHGRVSSWTPDGKPEWMSGIHIDITERKAADAALRASEERFRGLFSALPDGVLLADPATGGFAQFNDSAAAMLGWDRDGFQRLGLAGLCGPDGPLAPRRRLDLIVAAGRDDYETTLWRRDGETVPVAISAVALMEGARPLILMALRDISAHRRQQEAMEAARAAAEAANAAKSMFLANMSHEIRTPMNGVMGMADALSRRVTDPEERRMLAVIKDSGESLLSILNDILDLSKVEAGRMTLDEAPFSPAALVGRIEGLHALNAAGKGVAFRTEIHGSAVASRIGDSQRVLQMLHNLVGNAVKFTEKGSVTVAARAGDDGVAFEIRDTGVGMSEAQLARVFDDFTQADNSTTRRFGGTGLGLSIVRRFADMMGGSISLESAPGAGATARLVLPLPLVDSSAPASSPTVPGATGRASLAASRVLAADDNEINRLVISEVLKTLGVHATLAEGGIEAVELARSQPFDILLLDISMPDMDGVEALARIRRDAAAAGRPRTPALAVTANAFAHHVEEYRAAGFDGHVSKPISLDRLRDAMVDAIESAPAAAD